MGASAVGADRAERRLGFADALRTRVFAVLYVAEVQSTVGDQLARVALSVLVFRRTGSAAATALTYAATYLPAILGGVVLAGIGDRLPRRLVMIGCDAIRAVLFAVMALLHLPTIALVGLLVVAVFLGPAFAAAEVSYLAAALEPELFRVGTGLRMISGQASQVFGFAAGGALVALLGPRGALAVNAGTYVVSAFVIAVALRSGRAAGRHRAAANSAVPDHAVDRAAAVDRAGDADPHGKAFAGLWRDERTRAFLALSALAGLFVVPEGLAVPFGSAAGASTVETGLLMAAIPLGGALGAGFLVRLVPRASRLAVAGWMAVGCGLPLVVTGLVPRWPIALGCWLLSGALAAYQVEVTTALVQHIPDALRARLIGIASSVLLGAQGLGLVVFAGIATVTTPGRAIGIAGLAGSAIALLIVVGPLRAGVRNGAASLPPVDDVSILGPAAP
jgi:hypothetical protein